MKKQNLRKLLLLLSFSFFPITILYLSPGPPVMSLKAGVINLSVIVILTISFQDLFSAGRFAPGSVPVEVVRWLHHNYRGKYWNHLNKEIQNQSWKNKIKKPIGAGSRKIMKKNKHMLLVKN